MVGGRHGDVFVIGLDIDANGMARRPVGCGGDGERLLKLGAAVEMLVVGISVFIDANAAGGFCVAGGGERGVSEEMSEAFAFVFDSEGVVRGRFSGNIDCLTSEMDGARAHG